MRGVVSSAENIIKYGEIKNCFSKRLFNAFYLNSQSQKYFYSSHLYFFSINFLKICLEGKYKQNF